MDDATPRLSAAGAVAAETEAPRVPEGETAPQVAAAPEPAPDSLASPDLYLNRELTWLAFNSRVLAEAEDEGNPLLERLKFLSIVASNLDEFFMKRIGGLKQQQGAGLQELTVDGRTPARQIEECYQVVRAQEARQASLLPALLAQLRRSGIRVTTWESLTLRQQKAVRDHYYDNIFPLVTPQTSDPAHPFPFVSNLSLNLLITIAESSDQGPGLARVKVPVGAGIPRFLEVGGTRTFVTLESVIAGNLDLLFPEVAVEGCTLFRVTRNANAERDEEAADDLLALIETEMRERRFAPIVRIEVSRDMPSHHRGMIAAELGVDEHADVFEVEGMLALRDLIELARLPDPALRDPPFAPVDHPAFVWEDRPLFHVIRDRGSILVQHPFQSYATSVERFLAEASTDPKVRAIKMTVYRTDAESKVVEYLIDAAQHGKQVAVVVELKARFEEEANIRWANRLEEAGIHVTYGVVGLKTHCKVILVVRQDYNGLRRYAHIGTGNYNAETARVYTDLGLFTCDPLIGQDLTELFNYLTTGYKPKRKYAKLLPSPKHCKPALLQKIQREIEHQQAGETGLIQFKTNAIEDADVTRALYRAARAGVRVDLVVRDTCRLRPGIAGLSENVRVVSVVGRFLEHSRIYHFRNGGQEEYWIGSADCMKRNLESRVEVLAPVEAPELRKELRLTLEALLADTRGAWELAADGTYTRRRAAPDEPPRSAQQVLVERAAKHFKEASRLKRRRPRAGVRRERE